MQTFEYVAWDNSGNCHEGLKQANSRQEVLNLLKQEDLTPVTINEIQTVATEEAGPVKVRPRRVSSEQLSAFCWQLATMLEGGLSITAGIQTIAEDTNNPYFEFVLFDLASSLEKGETFSQAISAHPKVFNHLSRAMVMAGETGGSIIVSLKRLGEYYQERDKLVRKIRGAMAYPIFVVVFIVAIVVVLMTLIIPKFEIIFEQFKGELPLFTRAFMGVYNGIIHNLPFLLIGLAGTVIGLITLSKTKFGYAMLCKIELKLPLLGKIKQMAFVCMFCKTLATLSAAGVSVLDAFSILAEMNHNDLLRDGVLDARRRMTEGSDMASSIAACGLFPGVAIKMTQIGEQSGSLVPVMEKTGEFYSRKVDELVSMMLGMLEPALIIAVGAIVGVVLLAMYLPIFSMSV